MRRDPTRFTIDPADSRNRFERRVDTIDKILENLDSDMEAVDLNIRDQIRARLQDQRDRLAVKGVEEREKREKRPK